MSLPIIDLSPFLSLNPDPTAQKSCAASIHDACIRYGFFYITGLGLEPRECEEPLEVVREFFQLPTEEKVKCKITMGDRARGYQLLNENVTQGKFDHQEAWDAYKPVLPAQPDRLLHGENQWPSQPASFKPKIEAWVEKMKRIGHALNRATAQGLGVEMEGKEWDEFKEIVSESFWVLRAIAYPTLPKDEQKVSCGSHCDYGLWTLLHADSTKGALQVFINDPQGQQVENGRKGTWINADPIPGAFVINIGDMWEVLSNGLYKATTHRVIHRGENLRISLPFFFEPNFDAVIEPLDAAVRHQQRQYPGEEVKKVSSINYGRHLEYKISHNFAFKEETLQT